MNKYRKYLRHGAVLLACFVLLSSGCASGKAKGTHAIAFDDPDYDNAERRGLSPSERFSYDYRAPVMARLQSDDRAISSTVLNKARTAIGTPYVSGGASLSGFDCSGFVRWAYNHAGISLPRTAREQALYGEPVDSQDMVAGDIVAFRHPRRGYHTGIYIGDGKFIHSPRQRKRVQIASLDDPYFNSTFLGARRVTSTDTFDEVAADRLLAMYNPSKSRSDAWDTPRASTQQKKQSTARSSRKNVRSQRDSHKKQTLAQASAQSSRKQNVTQASSQSSRKQTVAQASAQTSRKQSVSTKNSPRKEQTSQKQTPRKQEKPQAQQASSRKDSPAAQKKADSRKQAPAVTQPSSQKKQPAPQKKDSAAQKKDTQKASSQKGAAQKAPASQKAQTQDKKK